MRVNVRPVMNWAAVQFICSLLMEGFPLSPWTTYHKGNLWLAPAGCRDQALKGEEILDAGLSCLLLSKVTDLTGIKWGATASYVLVLNKEKAQMLVLLPLILFYLTMLSASILDQAQVNLSSWALPKPHFQGHLFHFLLEWQSQCFQVNP